MGLSIADAREMSLWEYEAILTTWNLRHDPDGDLEPVTIEQWQATQSLFASNPHLLN